MSLVPKYKAILKTTVLSGYSKKTTKIGGKDKNIQIAARQPHVDL